MKKTLFALMLIPVVTMGQVGPPAPVTVLTWDPVTTDVQGNPESTVSSEAAVTLVGQDPNLGGTVIQRAVGESNEVPLSDLISDLDPGKFQLWVRVVDESGNWSAYGGPLAWDNLPPTTPANVRIEIRVTVGG